MDTKFFSSLFEGDSANGVKLCMGLTGGDFWARINGCQNLYRGLEPSGIDLNNIVCTVEPERDSIEIPEIVTHQPGQAYFYLLRQANCCGNEEETFNAVLKVEFDGSGDLVQGCCNDVLAVQAEQIPGQKVRLHWFYCPIHQADSCKSFRVYSDNGSGQIDYEKTISVMAYHGPDVYVYETQAMQEGRYRFCIRPESVNGQQGSYSGQVSIDITIQSPEGIDDLSVECI